VIAMVINTCRRNHDVGSLPSRHSQW